MCSAVELGVEIVGYRALGLSGKFMFGCLLMSYEAMISGVH